MPRTSTSQLVDRVREILQDTCDADGQGNNLQETQRRKAYRAGINRALEAIQTAQSAKDSTNTGR